MISAAPRRTAFTLVELLVVVTIVLVLLGLLLPAVGGVMGQARSSRCLSNQRMITVAMNNYLIDNDGYLPHHAELDWGMSPNPLAGTGAGNWWMQRVNPYIDETYRGDNFKGNNVFHCAHAEAEVRPQWKFWDRFSFHFAMNTMVQGKWWQKFDATHVDYWQRRLVNRNKVKADTVIFADGKVSQAGALGFYFWDEMTATAYLPWQLDGAGLIGTADATMRDRRIVGHRGTVNRAFMDGHVAAIAGTWKVAEENPLWAN